MSDELIKRIREGYNNWDSGYKADGALLGEAADLIEQQAARITELEADCAELEHDIKRHIFNHAADLAELEARISANGAEPVAWQSPSGWLYDDNPNGFADWTPLYAAPIATGPRYDWTVSGMKQSEMGNWVMAASAEKGDGNAHQA